MDRRTFVRGALGGALIPLSPGPIAAQGELREVSIRNFVYEPETLAVKPGDQIRFTNHDLAPHTATADDGSWDTGTLEKGQSVELTVTEEWTRDYFCAHHPAMTAKLIIG